MIKELSGSLVEIGGGRKSKHLDGEDFRSRESSAGIRLRMYRSNSNPAQELVALNFVDDYQPKHQLGPDYIIPTENIRCWSRDGATKLHVSSSMSSAERPISVVTYLKMAANNHPTTAAMAVKRNGKWIEWTYKDYWHDTRTAAKGFIKLGLKPFNGVGILGYNAPEWFIGHMAAIYAGGLAAGIYTTNSPEACQYILNDSNANIILVENEIQLNKILKIRSNLPNLKAIIQYTGNPTFPGVFTWEELMNIGRTVPDEVLDRRIRGLAINQCCCLVYTSGTTGNAKGVMLTHDNVVYNITYIVKHMLPFSNAGEKLISYLPLSHIAALQSDLYAPIAAGATTYFATPDALKGKLVENLTEINPAVMIGVPRVWEKIYEKIKEAEGSMSPGKRNLLGWARKQALAHHMMKLNGSNSELFSYSVAKTLVLKKIKKLLGFNHAKMLLSGGAPIAPEVIRFFLSLDIVLYESYGLSESSGPHAISYKGACRLGSVGPVSPVVYGKIEEPDDSGNGEILLGGRTIFMGYLGLETQTREALDDDGWLHTGDVGIIDKEDFVFITGRIKELLITSGGENVAPVPIEDAIKELLPVVSNCMVIGDKKKFLSLFITIKTEIDLDTLLPTGFLRPVAITWCKKRGCDFQTVSQILEGPDRRITAGIQEGINQYNNKLAISNAQKIQKWLLLPHDFSVPGGELGPTLKLKRSVVLEKFQDEVASIYNE